MPVINGKEVLANSPEALATKNARGGINKTSNREASGQVSAGSTSVVGQDNFKIGNISQQNIGSNISKLGAITPTDLTSTPVINVPTPTTPTQAPALQADLMAQQEQADAFTQAQTEARKTAEAGKNTALADYLAGLKQTKGLSTLQAEAYAAPGGVNEITPELNDINDQIRREQRALDLATRDIQDKGGGLKMGVQAEIANLTRESLKKQADLSIIQMAVQGRYDSAKEIADRAVAAQFEQQQIYNDTLKFAYTENKDLFDKTEQREFETLLDNRNRVLEEAKASASEIKQFALSALQSGAPTSLVQKMMSAGTLDEAIALGGSYLQPKAADASIKAPETKNFGTSDNPIWKQFNTTTGQWEDVQGVGATGNPQDVTNSLNQFDFLLDTVDRVVGSKEKGYEPLYKSSGKGVIDRATGFLTGNTKYNRLEAQVDTLRSNMLTLATDPNIKQFFGPQMSDADVRLMTAAGTTLRPSSQDPNELKQEAERIGELVNRMKTAVQNGVQNQSITPNIITAPDGTQVEIID